jgi:hypothetical protein
MSRHRYSRFDTQRIELRLSTPRPGGHEPRPEGRRRLSDHEDGHYIVAVEQLDGETLVLVEKDGLGRPGGFTSLHFRRQ